MGRLRKRSKKTNSERRPLRSHNQLVPAGGGRRFPRGKYHTPGDDPRMGYSPREVLWQLSRAF